MKEDIRTEVAYTLPVNEGQKAHFKDLFNDLDSHSERLQISSYGISDATLDEVGAQVSVFFPQLYDKNKPFGLAPLYTF